MMYKITVYLLLSITLYSCSEAKKIQKAEQIVLTNPPSFEKVGRKYIDLNPCVPDSVVKILPGLPIIKTDTVVQVKETRVPDTVYKTITKTITNTINKTDTIKISVKDDQKENLLKKDINKLKDSQAGNLVKIVELQRQVDKYKSLKNKWFWLFIAISVSFGIYIFRKPIISLITKI